jgi:hypothetical protein
MGSKGPSGNTTTTQTQTNPASTAQLPYLQDLWGSASNLGQQSSSNITGLQNYAQNQAANTSTAASAVMPAALDAYNAQIALGNPSQAQSKALTNAAAVESATGQGYSSKLNTAADTALGQVSDWQNRFTNAGETANQTLQGYGSGALSSLSGVGNPALSTLPGMGQQATSLSPGSRRGAQRIV